MTTRTTQIIVHFNQPFSLPGLDGGQAAGDYRVEHDEEAVEAFSRLMWIRVRSYIHLPGMGVGAQMHQMFPINPSDLDAALEKDLHGHREP